MLRRRCSRAISTRPATSSGMQTARPTPSFTLHPLARRSFSGAGPLACPERSLRRATFFHPSLLPAATLPLSTLVQSSLPTPLQSTHTHLSHSRPPITPAVATHADLILPKSFPCNTCEKRSCCRRADILLLRTAKNAAKNRSEDRPLHKNRERRGGNHLHIRCL